MTAPLDVTIITGLSGAGRSSAADVLEDLGCFVIDNLPPALIPKVAELARDRERPSRYALVVDVRSGEFMDELVAALAALRATGVRTRMLFLDASDAVLVRRFEASRRPHPLAPTGRVSDGIARERVLLEELKGEADVVVDTSDLNVHELRDRLRALFGDAPTPDAALQTNLLSFGYKFGIPLDVDLIFDCRFLPNPHWIDELRPLDGTDDGVRRYVLEQPEATLQTSLISFGYKFGIPLDVDLLFDCRFLPNPHWVEDLRPRPGTDEAVRRYVLDQPAAQAFLEGLRDLFALLLPAYAREGKSYLAIGVGCTGGRHRSVVIAAELAKLLAGLGFPPTVHHRDLDRG